MNTLPKILLAIAIAAAVDTLLGCLDLTGRWVVRFSARRLPPELRSRCEEEWLAQLEDVPARTLRFLHALSCIWGTWVLLRERPTPGESAAAGVTQVIGTSALTIAPAVQCSGCGAEVAETGTPGEQRQPCRTCGSLSRIFNVEVRESVLVPDEIKAV